MAARLSCIVPVFNGAAFIAEALDSIAAQTRPPDEVVVVDDGSIDGSAAVAAAHPVGCRVLPTTHRGAAHARNLGVAASSGDLLSFLDADDLWSPAKCSVETAVLADRDDVDLVVSRAENFIDPAVPLTGDDDWRRPLLGPEPALLLQCTTVRRALFDRIGGFDETIVAFGEDTDWFMRAIAAGAGMERLSAFHVRRRLHRSNLVRTLDNAARLDAAFLMISRHLQRKRETGSQQTCHRGAL